MHELQASTYGLDLAHCALPSSSIVDEGRSAEEIVRNLERIYCGSLAIEVAHVSASCSVENVCNTWNLQSYEERQWIIDTFEATQKQAIDSSDRLEYARLMGQSQVMLCSLE